jgi:hypothetical protein
MLTLEAVREAARTVVAKQGADFVYRKAGEYGQCLYVKLGDERLEIDPDEVCASAAVTPCLVGAIIERLGKMNLEIANSGRSIGALLSDDVLGQYEPAVRNYLAALQGEQDAGKPWGEALTLAEQQV